jgi:hypothetical protein
MKKEMHAFFSLDIFPEVKAKLEILRRRNTMWHANFNGTWLLLALVTVPLIIALAAGPQGTKLVLKSGQAKGTFTKNGKSIPLTHAFVYVDQKDDRKPVLLLIVDRQVPAESWTSEFDFMRFHSGQPLTGVCYWLDKDREVFRTDYYWEGRQASTMGIFELELEKSEAKRFVGKALSTPAALMGDDKFKLDVSFNAALK